MKMAVGLLVVGSWLGVTGEVLPVVPQVKRWAPAGGTWQYDARQVREALDAGGGFAPEGYRLAIAPEGARLTAGTAQGLAWGRQTLEQLRRHAAAIPCGTIDDAPKYRMRGFMLDVARKPYSLAFLRALVKDLAYYKMNTFHIHLNDDGASEFTGRDRAVRAFRLESETYPGLAAGDLHYTKAAFRAFVKESAALGVTVVPEIDSPAHAGCFADYFRKAGRKDRFSIAGNFTNTVAFIEKLYDEYLGGPDPVFAGPYVHIGMDEFGHDHVAEFRAYGDELRRIVRKHGKKVEMWGATEHPDRPDGEILCDIWSAGGGKGYDPIKMIGNGYDVTCLQGGMLYIVPAAGYYNDYLRVKWLFENWEPHVFGPKSKTTPDEPHLLGGKFAVWNDLSENGTSEDDTFDRVMPALGVVAEKTWAGARTNLNWATWKAIFEQTGEAPGVNLADRLTGPGGTVGAGDRAVGWSQGGGYRVTFELKPAAGRAAEETLFDDGFSRVFLTAEGRIGFFRDGLGHTFAAQVPAEKWSRVTLAGNPDGVDLLVNDVFSESTRGRSHYCLNWCNRGHSLYLRSPRTLHFPLVRKAFSGALRGLEVRTGYEPKILTLNADDYRTGGGFADIGRMAANVKTAGADGFVIENARVDGPVEGGTQPKKGEAAVLAFRCCLAGAYGDRRVLSTAQAPDGTKRENVRVLRVRYVER